MCLIKNDIMQYVTKVDREVPDNIIVTIHGGNTIFGLYIPPSDSIYYSDTCFTSIPNIFHNVDGSHVVIGGGDLNSRVGNVTQTLPLMGATYRSNIDKVVNTHGKLLKKICNSYKCYIVNNLNVGSQEFGGDFTFFKGDRKSQNDLCVSNAVGLRQIEDFTIHKIGWNFSDHFPISVKVKLCLYDSRIPKVVSEDLLTSMGNEGSRRPVKVKSHNVDWEGYRTIAKVELEMMRDEIEYLNVQPNTTSLNNVISSLSEALYKAAKTCENKIERVTEKPVHDPTPSMTRADEQLKLYSSGLCSWEDWNEIRMEAVEDISNRQYSKLIQQWNEVLSSSDSKSIWDKIDWKGKCADEVFDGLPKLEELADQFQSKDGEEDECLMDLDFGENYVSVLDREITVDELKNASDHLKEGKSTSDGWAPQMVTEIKDTLFPLLLLIFNIILQNSIYPSAWWISVVIALFKNKGSRWIAKYFRPVSLVQMLFKLFDFTLLGRFNMRFIPDDRQTAYQTGKSSGDHIFLMRCWIEQFNLEKRKLFITAVDFDGAFDRVKRSTLLRKLLAFGAGSLFVLCLANLYTMSVNTIYSNGASVSYMLHSGIKQGLPLSPYLFLFYIDDVFQYFDELFSKDSLDIYDRLHILIHADDANLFATARNMMISKLHAMLTYCRKNSIVLQPIKCFFTVINGSVEDQESLQLSPEDTITYAEYLEILGSHISGNIIKDLALHFKKRFNNIIKFFNYLRENRIAPVVVKLKVLKACVMSALLYNCEAFGPHIPEGMEEMYHRMIKAALGVRDNCANRLALIESGFLPLSCLIQARQLNFFRRFKESLQKDSVREAMFNELLEKKSAFLKHYIDLDSRYEDSYQLISEQVDELKLKIRTLGANKDRHYKHWIYLQMNPELKPSPFLSRIDVVGKALTKFRLGSHKLKIETGRWSRTKRELRLCSTCGDELGDEFHAVYSCSGVHREDLQLPPTLSDIWSCEGVNTLMKRFLDMEWVK